MPRFENRPANALRAVVLKPHAAKHAEGSCLVQFGDTHVLCTASVEEKVPPFLKNTGQGWVTAEYGMLPRSTHSRMDREAAKGKQSGRTQEIQRLIGRALRSVVDMGALGERQIKIDCDVLQADGGTRTAAITGGYVALALALRGLQRSGKLKDKQPLLQAVAAISCGISNDGQALLDLDYAEDAAIAVDSNFVFTEDGNLVEVQGTAERGGFSTQQFLELLELASRGCHELFTAQAAALTAA